MTPRKKPEDRLKLGRPTKYKKKYCELLKQHRKDGYGYHSFAAIVGVDIETLYNWEKANPDFLGAKKESYPHALHYWEKMGKLGAAGKLKNFNSTAFIYTTKNMFRDEYNDKQEHDINVEGQLTSITTQTKDPIEAARIYMKYMGAKK